MEQCCTYLDLIICLVAKFTHQCCNSLKKKNSVNDSSFVLFAELLFVEKINKNE